MKKRITQQMVENWMGDDLYKPDMIKTIISEIANGVYKPEQLKEDILEYV